MLAPIVFRELSLDDLGQLQAIGRKTYFDAFAKDNTVENMTLYLAEAFGEERLTRELQNPNSTFYFVQESGSDQIAGFCKINFGPAQSEPVEDAIELERIYVLEDAQGKGYGKAMMQKAIEMGRAAGVSYLWLGVWEKNEAAIAFYEQFGYERFGQHIYHLGNDPQLDYLMRIRL